MPKIMLDAHVHLHSGVPPQTALRRAHRRMTAQGGPDSLAVVLLAEQTGCHAFQSLRPSARPTQEEESLWLDHDGSMLLVIAGRQVVSAEGLEILAQATSAQFEDGLPATELLRAMRAVDAIVTLPWGVGKWLGARGRLVDDLLQADQPEALLLGDNGGRPAFWPEPRFRARPVLRGSDPLPISGDGRRIGTFGTVLRGTLSQDRPARDLRRLLRRPGERLEPYGTLASPFRFLSNQLRLRMSA